MPPHSIFSFGYYGWGNHTPELVEAVDAVEADRGFEPPLFVDIRIRRSVRAVGFTGPAFERLLGPGRHRWMRSLGRTARRCTGSSARRCPRRGSGRCRSYIGSSIRRQV
jgi:hypothetical protein